MQLPYHILIRCGEDGFVAAQGHNIHGLGSGLQHQSTWSHPLADQQNVSGAPPPATEKPPTPEGPPSKRRRVNPGQDSEQNGEGNGETAETPAPAAQNGKQGKGKKAPNPNERPFIQSLAATADGRYVVAVTGCDKTIWVLENDGKGNLRQLSRR